MLSSAVLIASVIARTASSEEPSDGCATWPPADEESDKMSEDDMAWRVKLSEDAEAVNLARRLGGWQSPHPPRIEVLPWSQRGVATPGCDELPFKLRTLKIMLFLLANGYAMIHEPHLRSSANSLNITSKIACFMG